MQLILGCRSSRARGLGFAFSHRQHRTTEGNLPSWRRSTRTTSSLWCASTLRSRERQSAGRVSWMTPISMERACVCLAVYFAVHAGSEKLFCQKLFFIEGYVKRIYVFCRESIRKYAAAGGMLFGRESIRRYGATDGMLTTLDFLYPSNFISCRSISALQNNYLSTSRTLAPFWSPLQYLNMGICGEATRILPIFSVMVISLVPAIKRTYALGQAADFVVPWLTSRTSLHFGKLVPFTFVWVLLEPHLIFVTKFLAFDQFVVPQFGTHLMIVYFQAGTVTFQKAVMLNASRCACNHVLDDYNTVIRWLCCQPCLLQFCTPHHSKSILCSSPFATSHDRRMTSSVEAFWIRSVLTTGSLLNP